MTIISDVKWKLGDYISSLLPAQSSSAYNCETLLYGEPNTLAHPSEIRDPSVSTPANYIPSEIGSHKFGSTVWTHRTTAGMFKRWHEQTRELVDQTITEQLCELSGKAEASLKDLLRGTKTEASFVEDIRGLGSEARDCISYWLECSTFTHRSEVAIVEDVNQQCSELLS